MICHSKKNSPIELYFNVKSNHTIDEIQHCTILFLQTQSELEQKGKDLREEVGRMGEQVAEAKMKAREDKILLEAKVNNYLFI